MNEYIKYASFVSLATILIVSGAALIINRDTAWAAGYALGVLWWMANLFFTVRILQTISDKSSSSRLRPLILIKFPVLYLVGAFILFSKAFPVMSIVLGSFSVFLIVTMVILWQNTLRRSPSF